MGVFKKLKDVLFDVEEDEIPVITKEPKEEIIKEDNPIKEVKIPKEEARIPKEESKFNFPLDFNEDPKPSRVKNDYNFDEDFGLRRNSYNEPPVKAKEEFNYLREEPKKKETKEPFKPTPIISPVYGVLDQNYTKDDVIIKTDIGVKSPDLDEVRRKAYGIDKKKDDKKDAKKEAPDPLKTLDELLLTKDEKKKEPVKEEIISEPVLKEEVKEEKVYDDELPDEPFSDEKKTPVVKEKAKDPDDTLETDLFNLIDSMYEDKKESEEDK